MTNNHLYWTVTTILQEQSGTRRGEIVKHMIKIASVLSCPSVVVHPIGICYVLMLCGYSLSFMWIFSYLLRILKRSKKLQYNVCHTKVFYTCVYRCTVMFYCVYLYWVYAHIIVSLLSFHFKTIVTNKQIFWPISINILVNIWC